MDGEHNLLYAFDFFLIRDHVTANVEYVTYN